MILIFFGPPGAGKGTQASFTSKILNIPHLSTGEILRNKLLEKDPLSLKLKKIINKGNLVSDEILNNIIANRISFKDCNNGFILDGYPRTIEQKNFLIDFFTNNNLLISFIFDFSLEEKIIIERIKSRLTVEKREDDRQEIYKTRISKYLKETKPVSDFYKEKFPKKYHVINGNQKIEFINADILKILKK